MEQQSDSFTDALSIKSFESLIQLNGTIVCCSDRFKHVVVVRISQSENVGDFQHAFFQCKTDILTTDRECSSEYKLLFLNCLHYICSSLLTISFLPSGAIIKFFVFK